MTAPNSRFHKALSAAVAELTEGDDEVLAGHAITNWVLVAEGYNPDSGEFNRAYMTGPMTPPWTALHLAEFATKLLDGARFAAGTVPSDGAQQAAEDGDDD